MPQLLRRCQHWQGAIARDLARQQDGWDEWQGSQRWLLKWLMARQYEQACGLVPSASWGQLQDRLAAIAQADPGLIPADWLMDDPQPSDRLWQKLTADLSQQSLDPSLLAAIYERSPRGQGMPAEAIARKAARKTARKTDGVYYTPAPLVQMMVQQTVQARLRQPGAVVRILDPACGCGGFLLASLQVLQAWYGQQYQQQSPQHPALWTDEDGQTHLTLEARSHLVQTHLHGLELDEQAAAIARLSLGLALLQPPTPDPQVPLGLILQRAVQVGNTLLQIDWQPLFPAAMEQGGFEIVLGNPPYLDAEQMTAASPTWRSFCTAHYQTARGNWDSFCIFIEQALNLCQVGGWVSLVVPSKLLSADYAAATRSLLLRHRLCWMRDYTHANTFPAASVYPIVFCVEKCAQAIASHPPVPYQVMQSLDDVTAANTPAAELQVGDRPTGPDPGPWRVVQITTPPRLLAHFERQTRPLGAIASVHGAATVAEAYALQALIQDLAEGEELPPQALPMVNSGTLDRYRVLWGKKKLRYLGAHYQRPYLGPEHLHQLSPKRCRQAHHPKVIVAGLTRRLEGVLDEQGKILPAKSTSIILADSSVDLRYYLGILNSRVMDCYVQIQFASHGLRDGYLCLGPPQLRQLPILPRCYRAQSLLAWVDHMLTLMAHPNPSPDDYRRLDECIDRAVCALYGLDAAETEWVLLRGDR
ncbi:DNA methyltransferase [Leptolyngbya sp. CCY15150]|uniref:Eco57I restriction-modification methylase domain-containing protein n=1 Tax=Leptolyngbya sp. CCY15150 TaxID=2767772 RepID=UPI001951952D